MSGLLFTGKDNSLRQETNDNAKLVPLFRNGKTQIAQHRKISCVTCTVGHEYLLKTKNNDVPNLISCSK